MTNLWSGMTNLWVAVVLLLVGIAGMSALIGFNHVPFSFWNFNFALSAVVGLLLSGVFAGRI